MEMDQFIVENMGFKTTDETASYIRNIGLKYNLIIERDTIDMFYTWHRMNNYLSYHDDTSNLKIALLIELFNEARINSSEVVISSIVKGKKRSIKIENEFDILNK